MCGRFTNQYTWRELVEIYRHCFTPISNLEPRFNFAPMQRGIVVRLDRESAREPAMMRRGLVSSWAKVGPTEKQHDLIATKGGAPFAFAGLWEWWQPKDRPKDAAGLETSPSRRLPRTRSARPSTIAYR